MKPREDFIAYTTIVRKEATRFFRIWTQTLLPSVMTQALYFVIFGKFIGSQLGPMEGIPYMAFIVPGLVMMAVINNSFSNVVSSFYGSKFQRSIEEILVSSTPNGIIVAGYVTGGLIRGLMVGCLVFLVSIVFTHPVIYHLGLIVVFIVLTSIVFSLGGLLNAIFARSFDDVSLIPTFVLTPLTYLGGVFYSIKNLPEFWQTVSKLNPVLYLINGFRYGFYGISDVHPATSFFILMGLTIFLIVTNLHVLNKGYGLKA